MCIYIYIYIYIYTYIASSNTEHKNNIDHDDYVANDVDDHSMIIEQLLADAEMNINEIENLPSSHREATNGKESSKWLPSINSALDSLSSEHLHF